MASPTLTHTKVLTVPEGADSSVVRTSDWNAEHTLRTTQTGVVLGRSTAGAGAVEEIAHVSGVYTPTLTNGVNLAASTAYQCQYVRMGSVVTVSGKVSVDPTAAAAATELGISLPIASNFGAAEDCGGVAFATAIAGQGAGIIADAVNDRASMNWVSGDMSNQAMSFTFTYRVI